MKLTKYNNYKNTNIHWLGDIPQHWELKRNKNIFFEVSNLSKTGKETLLTVSHITGVTPRSEKNVNMFLAETMEGYKICQKGDLIINTMWAWMGALGTSKYEGICSPAYNIYRGRKWVNIDPRFFDYLYRTPMFVKEMTKYSKGIVESRLRLYPKDFFQINTGLPPITEQTAIANFLDQKTAQIGKKVDLLTQKIEKYKELKKSLINQTVCRGLGKNIKLKPSGIDWIGDIPEHWKIERLKNLVNIVGRIGYRGYTVADIVSEGEGALSFSPSNILNQTIDFKKSTYISFDKYEESPEIKVFNGDIIFVKTASVGKVGIVKGLKYKATINPQLVVFKNYRMNGELLYYIMVSSFMQEQINFDIFGGVINTITQKAISNYVVILPPLKEQTIIAQYLDQKTNKFDQIIANLSQQIEALKGLRKTLINEVVTGKVRVID